MRDAVKKGNPRRRRSSKLMSKRKDLSKRSKVSERNNMFSRYTAWNEGFSVLKESSIGLANSTCVTETIKKKESRSSKVAMTQCV
jgi:hypothetical protein